MAGNELHVRIGAAHWRVPEWPDGMAASYEASMIFQYSMIMEGNTSNQNSCTHDAHIPSASKNRVEKHGFTLEQDQVSLLY